MNSIILGRHSNVSVKVLSFIMRTIMKILKLTPIMLVAIIYLDFIDIIIIVVAMSCAECRSNLVTRFKSGIYHDILRLLYDFMLRIIVQQL